MRVEVFATRTLPNGDRMRVVSGFFLGNPTYFIEAREAKKDRGFRPIGRRDNVKEAIAEMDKRYSYFSEKYAI